MSEDIILKNDGMLPQMKRRSGNERKGNTPNEKGEDSEAQVQDIRPRTAVTQEGNVTGHGQLCQTTRRL